MKRRRLGNSNLWITPIGVGGWAMGGGGWKYALGPQDDRQSIATIKRALEAGINWIDTAALYGLGHSEEVVAKALEDARPRPYIFTKCSRVWDERGVIFSCLKRESIMREAEASLRRLRVECIDLYQIHWPWPDEQLEEGWGAMADLQRQGKVRWIGVSNFTVPQLRRVQRIAPVTSVQTPYSLVARAAEQAVIPFAAKSGIGVITYSPMRSGLLSGSMSREVVAALPSNDCRRELADFKEPLLSRNLQIVELLSDIGRRYGRSVGEVAVAWVLRNRAVTGAVVGFRKPQHVDEMLNAVSFPWDSTLLREIERCLDGSRGLALGTASGGDTVPCVPPC